MPITLIKYLSIAERLTQRIRCHMSGHLECSSTVLFDWRTPFPLNPWHRKSYGYRLLIIHPQGPHGTGYAYAWYTISA